jgi:hypothetical protein
LRGMTDLPAKSPHETAHESRRLLAIT